MHVTLIPGLSPGRYVIPVIIDRHQLRLLQEYVISSFKAGSNHMPVVIPVPGYGSGDFFFEAEGRFSILKPCNEWTNEGLRKAGIRCAAWSPFDKAIFYQLSQSKK